MDEQKIVDFHHKLTYERVNNSNVHEVELKTSYMEILQGMTTDYSAYRKYISRFLSSLETNNDNSISYSVVVYFNLYEQLIKTEEFENFDLSILDYDINEDTLEKVNKILENSYLKSSEQRLSEDNIDVSSLSDEDKKGMTALIIHKLQDDARQLNWGKEMVELTMMQLILLRQLLSSLNNLEVFYSSIGMFFDRLVSSEYFQAGRDIAEEVIISSYKDGLPEYGYFNAFRLYSNIGSIHASLLYANLSLTCILRKEIPYSEKYVKEVIWQGIKFFRNVHLFPWAKKIYAEIPISLRFLEYEKRAIDHTYFTSLLVIMEPDLPSLLLDYMSKEREYLIAGDINEALPWLITLYNVRKYYPNADFSPTGFGFFLNIFEFIVPPEIVKKNKEIIEMGSGELKKYLKESLVKLNETRYASDFVYDNESAIKISNRLIEYSAKIKEPSSFLLAMLLKSDFSILFRAKESKELMPLLLPDVNIDTLDSLYENTDEFFKILPISFNVSLNWLAFTEGGLYQVQLFNKDYSFFELSNWSYEAYKELVDNDYFVNISFSDTVKDKFGVRLITPEEYREEEIAIAQRISIAKLFIHNQAEEIQIIKDMELSKFPHNLFLNDNGDFLSKYIPITNVLSTEWLLKSAGTRPLSINYSKSIWIPIETGDYTLNYLYNNIEKTIQENSFLISQQMELEKPLDSDINIICSHGSKNISETQVFFQENNSTYNLNSIVGKGRVLILFVCYSGSMKTEFFRNDMLLH